jgi:hypothetical protein
MDVDLIYPCVQKIIEVINAIPVFQSYPSGVIAGSMNLPICPA